MLQLEVVLLRQMLLSKSDLQEQEARLLEAEASAAHLTRQLDLTKSRLVGRLNPKSRLIGRIHA